MLKKLTLGCVLLLYATAPRLNAQLPKASEYFPLEVGNVWEYNSYDTEKLRLEVISDTLVSDTIRVYKVRRQTMALSNDDQWHDDGFIYYHYGPDSNAVYRTPIFPPTFFQESIKILDTALGMNVRWEISEGDFGQDVAIYDSGTVALFGTERSFIDIYGFYDDTQITEPFAFWARYANGIGKIYTRDQAEFLIFAKVNNVDYGMPVTTDVKTVSHQTNIPNRSIICYPNPMKNSTTIILPVISKSISEIQIFNINGKMVQTIPNITQKFNKWDGKDKHNRLIPNGVYFLVANEGQINFTGRILVLR